MKGLYAAKGWYSRRLEVFTRWAVKRRVSPDVFTGVGVLFAILVPVGLLVDSPLLVLAGLAGRLAGANLDGAVARARGVSRPFGFILNEIGDRVSDLIIMAGLVILAVQDGSQSTVLWTGAALVAAFLPTFISLSAAGAGVPRANGGPFGKTERCATVFVLSVLLWAGVDPVAVLTWGSAVIIAGSVLTAVTRTLAARQYLSRNTP